MLSDNIRNRRQAMGLSQKELATKLNVVRQTISKWETGLSLPDAQLLIRLSEELDVPVGQLLDQTEEFAQLDAMAAQLALLRGQLAAQQTRCRQSRQLFFVGLGVLSLLFVGAQLACLLHQLWASGRLGGGIIGGGDTLTQISIISQPSSVLQLLAGLFLVLLAAVGIYRTKADESEERL